MSATRGDSSASPNWASIATRAAFPSSLPIPRKSKTSRSGEISALATNVVGAGSVAFEDAGVATPNPTCQTAAPVLSSAVAESGPGSCTIRQQLDPTSARTASATGISWASRGAEVVTPSPRLLCSNRPKSGSFIVRPIWLHCWSILGAGIVSGACGASGHTHSMKPRHAGSSRPHASCLTLSASGDSQCNTATGSPATGRRATDALDEPHRSLATT